jgi:hypothetical protein
LLKATVPTDKTIQSHILENLNTHCHKNLKSCRDDVVSTKLHIALDKQFFIKRAEGMGRGRERRRLHTVYGRPFDNR